MHILFCTGAKHSSGIKMCTPVSISFLNITLLNSTYFFYPAREWWFNKVIKELGGDPLPKKKQKQSILTECQECLTEIKIDNW